MIAVDTNILVYAHRADSEWNDAAYACISGLATGGESWALAWPCLHEFFAISTHPRIYDPPSRPSDAIDQIDAWLETPNVVLIGEHDTYWATLRGLLSSGRVRGPVVHDARIAALCLTHGVRELWTMDRDFSRFPGLRTKNPLTAGER